MNLDNLNNKNSNQQVDGKTEGKLTKIEISKLKRDIWEEAKKINNSEGVEAAILFTKNNWNENFGPIQIDQLRQLYEWDLLRIKPNAIKDNGEKKNQMKENTKMDAQQIPTTDLKLPTSSKRSFVNKKNVGIAFIVICIILIISNPTNSDFKNYLQGNGIDTDHRHRGALYYGRTMYFGIFSIYNAGNETYLGIFKNFIFVQRK